MYGKPQGKPEIISSSSSAKKNGIATHYFERRQFEVASAKIVDESRDKLKLFLTELHEQPTVGINAKIATAKIISKRFSNR